MTSYRGADAPISVTLVRLSRALVAALGVATTGVMVMAASAAARGVHAELVTRPARPVAGEPVELSFSVKDSLGSNVRFLQFVHERPMHLLIVSRDLGDFDHIHPELGADDSYGVTHTFRHGGAYRLFADYTPPGSGTRVDRFDVTVGGEAPKISPSVADDSLDHTIDSVRVTLRFDRAPRANEDLMMQASLTDASGANPVTDLELYLGALAHFIIVSEDLNEFIHAHPLETGEVFDPSASPNTPHVHDPALLAKVLVGPSPSTIRAATSFPRGGRYKLWMQFQRHGRILTVPFMFDVAGAPRAAARHTVALPAKAVRVSIGASGYTPARVEVRRGEPAVLAFSRPKAGNCGGTVVIPGLGVRRDVPVGQTVLVRFTPRDSSDIPFTCGMGMMQGLIVVK